MIMNMIQNSKSIQNGQDVYILKSINMHDKCMIET